MASKSLRATLWVHVVGIDTLCQIAVQPPRFPPLHLILLEYTGSEKAERHFVPESEERHVVPLGLDCT